MNSHPLGFSTSSFRRHQLVSFGLFVSITTWNHLSITPLDGHGLKRFSRVYTLDTTLYGHCGASFTHAIDSSSDWRSSITFSAFAPSTIMSILTSTPSGPTSSYLPSYGSLTHRVLSPNHWFHVVICVSFDAFTEWRMKRHFDHRTLNRLPCSTTSITSCCCALCTMYMQMPTDLPFPTGPRMHLNITPSS